MTEDNRELTHHEEEAPPALRAPITAGIAGLIITIGIFLILGTGTGDKHPSPRQSAIASPKATMPPNQPVFSSSPSATPTSVKPYVRWHGTVTVSGPDAHRDLDAIPPRTNDRESDINGEWLETIIRADTPSVQIAVLPHNGKLPGYTQCGNAAFSNGSDETEQLEIGDVLCVLTSQRRIARLKTIRAYQTSSDPIVKFSATVWDPPAP